MNRLANLEEEYWTRKDYDRLDLWTKVVEEYEDDFRDLGETGIEAYSLWGWISNKVLWNGELDPMAMEWIFSKFGVPEGRHLLLIKRIEAIHSKVREKNEQNQEDGQQNNKRKIH